MRERDGRLYWNTPSERKNVNTTPPVPAATGLITFFYYENLDGAVAFYRDVMGFELVTDQQWAKIFRVAGQAFVGCVDGARGYRRPSESKPVLLTVVVDDPDAWYAHFQGCGVPTVGAPRDDEDLGVRIFFLEDPEGYAIEIQKFY